MIRVLLSFLLRKESWRHLSKHIQTRKVLITGVISRNFAEISLENMMRAYLMLRRINVLRVSLIWKRKSRRIKRSVTRRKMLLENMKVTGIMSPSIRSKMKR